MPDLKIAVATNGDVPDNQCALKDAVLVAAATGITDPTEIVGIAQAFYAFLVNPGGGTAATAPAAIPAPPAEVLGSQPNEVVATAGGDNSTPAPDVAAPAAPAPAPAAPAAVAPPVQTVSGDTGVDADVTTAEGGA